MTAPLRDARERLRRLRVAGITAVPPILARVPAPIRRPIASVVASVAEGVATRRPRSRLAPPIALVARAAAGAPEIAAHRAIRAAERPTCRAGTRRTLARLAVAIREPAAAAEIASVAADDRAPELEVIRARAAYDAGLFGRAAAHAEAAATAAAGGSTRAEALALGVRASGQLRALEPGWLPDPGDATGRLVALSRTIARGRVLHLVSSALPYRTAGYNVRTRSVVACQRAAGLDPHVAVRTGFPAAAAAAGEARRRAVDGIDTWWFAQAAPGEPMDRELDLVARAGVEVMESIRPAALQPASNHVQAQVALALGRPAGIPVVYEARGFWEETFLTRVPGGEAAGLESDFYRLTREAEASVMRAVDAVVTLSEVMRTEIVGRGVEPDRIVVVPNAIDPAAFVPRPRDQRLAASLGIGRDDPVVGYVSTFNTYEGIPLLVEAAARLRTRHPGLRVLLVGDGEATAAIRTTAGRLGLDDTSVILPGRVAHEDVPGYYSLMDVFVVPRLRVRVAELVTPLKPYEAMALERAVVVSDLPALREIVTPGETGMVFRPGDVDDLETVLGTLLDDPDLRARLARNGREWVLHERTWASNGARYRELFERLGALG